MQLGNFTEFVLTPLLNKGLALLIDRRTGAFGQAKGPLFTQLAETQQELGTADD